MITNVCYRTWIYLSAGSWSNIGRLGVQNDPETCCTRFRLSKSSDSLPCAETWVAPVYRHRCVGDPWCECHWATGGTARYISLVTMGLELERVCCRCNRWLSKRCGWFLMFLVGRQVLHSDMRPARTTNKNNFSGPSVSQLNGNFHNGLWRYTVYGAIPFQRLLVAMGLQVCMTSDRCSPEPSFHSGM